MSKCIGCGITLQYDDPKKAGYCPNKENNLCERCFKIVNYNNHEIDNVDIDNTDLITKINQYDNATLFLVDFLSLNSKNIELFKKINNPKMLVITKMDIIPKNIDLFKLESKIKKVYKLDDLIFFSIKNNFGKRHIQDYINFYKSVVIVGPTSSGKSSLINHLFNQKLTVSNYKNTTQDFITLKLEDITLIDAPGFNDSYTLDNIKQTGFIKPRILTVKKGYSLEVNNYIIEVNKDSYLSLFLPNNAIVKTYKTKDKLTSNLRINDYEDLLINNLGFIYFKKGTDIKINTLNNIETRESIVGGL